MIDTKPSKLNRFAITIGIASMEAESSRHSLKYLRKIVLRDISNIIKKDDGIGTDAFDRKLDDEDIDDDEPDMKRIKKHNKKLSKNIKPSTKQHKCIEHEQHIEPKPSAFDVMFG
jgi:hypothetical protein